ncbi:outer membrane beta-barrel protein [Brumimicrobium mesophilum]|uniref:outer membrane beta-barrel protein n=1 Tax=Brumimicrobium mesophilum TaxID=392717 RepID=UPI000D13EB9D|nr:outer membrane beta-barrel protein [Brumimicrobium mesophilum]
MRTLFITTILSFFLVFSSQAQSLEPTEFSQPTKGDYILGGTLGFNLNTTPILGVQSRSLRFLIAPSFGKFISDKYLIRGGLGYSHSSNYYGSSSFENIAGRTNSFSLRFGVTRFYPIVDKLYFTLEGYIGGGLVLDNFSNGNLNTNSTNATIGVSPGLTYFINNRWMINSSMGVVNYKVSGGSGVNTHTINADLSANSFRLGVSYIFKGKNRE